MSILQRLGPSLTWFGVSGALFALSILSTVHDHSSQSDNPLLSSSSSSPSTSSTTSAPIPSSSEGKSLSYYITDAATITSIAVSIMGDGWSQIAAASLVLSFAWLIFQLSIVYALGPLRPLEDASIIKELQERLITNFSFRLLVLLVIISDIVSLHSWVLPFSWYTAITGLFALSLMSKRRVEQFINENSQYQQNPNQDNLSYISNISLPYIITTRTTFGKVLQQHFPRLFILGFVLIINTLLTIALVIALSSTKYFLHLLILLIADNVSIMFKTIHTSIIYITYLYTASMNHPLSNTNLSSMEAWRRDITEYADILFDGGSISVQLFHLLHIWYLHGLSFSLVDMILLLNVKSCITLLRNRWIAFTAYRTLNKQLDSLCKDAPIEQLRSKSKSNHNNASTTVSNTNDGLRYRGSTKELTDDKLTKETNDDDNDDEYEECSICLESMRKAKQLPVCGHMFHRHCLRGWLLAPGANSRNDDNRNNRNMIPVHRTCPLCRTAIDPQDVETQRRQRESATVNNNNGPQNRNNNLVNNMINHPLWTQLGLAFTGIDTNVDQDIQTLIEMFPHVSPHALRQHRSVSGNIHLTIDAALRGLLPAEQTNTTTSGSSSNSMNVPVTAEENITTTEYTSNSTADITSHAATENFDNTNTDDIFISNPILPSSLTPHTMLSTTDNTHDNAEDQGLATILAMASPTSSSITTPPRGTTTSSSFSSSLPSSSSVNVDDSLSPEEKRAKEREIRARAAEARLLSRK